MTTDAFFVSEVTEELHEALAEGLLSPAALHVAGVFFTGWYQGENLVRALLSGRKQAPGPAMSTPCLASTSRHNRRMQVSAYLKLSIAVAVATIALKTGAWWLTGSVGLLSDAMESVVNLAGAMFALAMVTVAARPPDEDHPFGHHKAEYFSSGFEGVLIFVAALAIIWAAGTRLLAPQPLEQLGLGLSLSVISSAMNGALAWAMLKKAREHRSMALEADARHLFTDVWTSAGVVLGLLAAAATGWLWLDPVIAIGVAANVAREGFSLVRRSADGLMDRALDPQAQQQIDEVLRSFEHPTTLRFDHINSRRAGQRLFVDLHMHMPPSWSLQRAAALRSSVEQALMAAVPGLRATIQLLPMDVEAHFDDNAETVL